MVNTNKLRGKIAENGLTFKTLAQQLGYSPTTIGRKIKNKTPMTLEEVELFREHLSIPVHQIMEYFFVEHVN
ncbi:MAG: helix-turn-helix transcriptional regulator [Ruminococcaceae bacterium]|nr:helix-turn-helix transcriptional regulator [Oscillospiraceae bacterium]